MNPYQPGSESCKKVKCPTRPARPARSSRTFRILVTVLLFLFAVQVSGLAATDWVRSQFIAFEFFQDTNIGRAIMEWFVK